MTLRAIVCILIFSLAGCGPGGPQIALRLKVAGRALDTPRGGPAPERGKPPPGIDAFRICVQDAAGRMLVCEDFTDMQASSVRLSGIPAGNRRIVTFQGYTINSDTLDTDVVWCGRAVGVNISGDKLTPVSMLLAHCGDFTETPGIPTSSRVFHTATLLPDGRVLIAGGYDSITPGANCTRPCAQLASSATVEIYDPLEGTFSSLPDLVHPRGLHAAMLLSDGRVLIAGGCEIATMQSSFEDVDRPGSPLRCLTHGPAASSAEIIDTRSGNGDVFDIPESVLGGSLPLADDRLLLLGGEDYAGQASRRAVIIDLSQGTPRITEIPQALAAARRSPVVVPISTAGQSPAEALVLGGMQAAGETDPGLFAERIVASGGGVASIIPRYVSSAAGVGLPVMHASGIRPLPGQLLISGGVYPGRFLSKDTPFLPQPIEQAAVIDTSTDDFTLLDANQRLGTPRALHATTKVDGFGHALVTGGFTWLDPGTTGHLDASAGVEAWDADAQRFSLAWLRGEPVEMLHQRAGHSATLLANGTILIIGGMDGDVSLASAEIFSPFSSKLGSGGLALPGTSPDQ
jgi:hypothetical protein